MGGAVGSDGGGGDESGGNDGGNTRDRGGGRRRVESRRVCGWQHKAEQGVSNGEGGVQGDTVYHATSSQSLSRHRGRTLTTWGGHETAT
jgi:hypothetical protein